MAYKNIEDKRKSALKWYHLNKDRLTEEVKERRKNDIEYRERRLKTERRSHQKHKDKRNAYNKEYSKNHLPERAASVKKSRTKTKLEVLSHYGKEGKLQCCWNECSVSDVDMLTLDHINNDGAVKRKEGERRGFHFYVQLRMDNYPEGYQTLCANHQLKKEIERKRNLYKPK